VLGLFLFFLGVADQPAELVGVRFDEGAAQPDGAGRYVFGDALAGRADRFLCVARIDQAVPGSASGLVGGAALWAEGVAALMPGLEVGVMVFGLQKLVARFVHGEGLNDWEGAFAA